KPQLTAAVGARREISLDSSRTVAHARLRDDVARRLCFRPLAADGGRLKANGGVAEPYDSGTLLQHVAGAFTGREISCAIAQLLGRLTPCHPPPCLMIHLQAQRVGHPGSLPRGSWLVRWGSEPPDGEGQE